MQNVYAAVTGMLYYCHPSVPILCMGDAHPRCLISPTTLSDAELFYSLLIILLSTITQRSILVLAVMISSAQISHRYLFYSPAPHSVAGSSAYDFSQHYPVEPVLQICCQLFFKGQNVTAIYHS